MHVYICTKATCNKVTTSSNEKYLHAASPSASFHCIDTETGDMIWKSPEKGNNIYLTQSKSSHDDNKFYSITHNDGAVIQQNACTRKIDWKFNCMSLTNYPICQDSVKGEFTLSHNNNIMNDKGAIMKPDKASSLNLYYGDIFGKIVALQVSIIHYHDTNSNKKKVHYNTLAPTSTNSDNPTTLYPTYDIYTINHAILYSKYKTIYCTEYASIKYAISITITTTIIVTIITAIQ